MKIKENENEAQWLMILDELLRQFFLSLSNIYNIKIMNMKKAKIIMSKRMTFDLSYLGLKIDLNNL